MKVLITGITGFVGSHLAEHLLATNGIEVHGIMRWRSNTVNIDHLRPRLQLHECDIRDATSVRQVMETVRPDRIVHLAAQSFVPTSWHAPQETLSTNIVGQLNVLEAVRQLRLASRILVIGSSEEYGLVLPEELPVKETNPLRPLSPYAVSKVGQDLLGYQYFKSYGLHIVRTRAFNHTGPRRGEPFATSNFAAQIARIERGLKEPVLQVGNLEAKRDFTDARDIVKAYWLALERGEPGEVYNIASGHATSIHEVAEMLLGMSETKIRIEVDPARFRPSDVPILIGDASKFIAQTGWRPMIPLRQTLNDLLDDWRQRLDRQAEPTVTPSPMST